MPYNGVETNGRQSTGRTNADYIPILGPDGRPMRPSWDEGGPESGMGIGHVAQFASMIGSAWKTFVHDRWDEAMRHGREEALAMRNDCFLQSLMQERALATASLKWHIEVDSDRDPAQKAVKEGMTQIVRSCPGLQKLLYYLTDETVWVGRGGSQVIKHWKEMDLPAVPRKMFGSGLGGGGAQPPAQPPQPGMAGNSAAQPTPAQPGAQPPPGYDPNADPSRSQKEKRRALCIKLHQPVSGDSLGHKHDGTPYLLVGHQSTEIPGSEIINATVGRALLLKGTWRPRFFLHSHLPMAANFFDAEKAEAIHGIGVRTAIFWWSTLRSEFLTNVMDWAERTGLGVRIWKYSGSNPQSKIETAKAAREQRDKVNLLVPVFGDGGKAVEGIEFIDTASTGADLLLKLAEYADSHIERFIIGQSMSSGADNESGLGGTGRSDFARDTKGKIVAFDANNLADTLTQDWIKDTLAWTYPDFADLPCRLVFDVDEQDPKDLLDAAKVFVDMGGRVRAEQVGGKLGFDQAHPGDELLKSQSAQQAEQQQAMQPPPGAAQPAPEAAPPAPPEQPAPNGDSSHFDFSRVGQPDRFDLVNERLARFEKSARDEHERRQQDEGWTEIPDGVLGNLYDPVDALACRVDELAGRYERTPEPAPAPAQPPTFNLYATVNTPATQNQFTLPEIKPASVRVENLFTMPEQKPADVRVENHFAPAEIKVDNQFTLPEQKPADVRVEVKPDIKVSNEFTMPEIKAPAAPDVKIENNFTMPEPAKAKKLSKKTAHRNDDGSITIIEE